MAAGLVVAGSGFAIPARGLTINPRSSWATEPPTGPLPPEDVKFLIVHHSASNNGHTPEDVPAILRSWYAFHTGPDRGWPDIAYNFIIDSAGGIWEGREGSLAGPVAGSANGGNQGYTQLVCVIGDYNVATPTKSSLNSLVTVLAWLGERYNVSTAPGAEVTFTSRGSTRWPEGTVVTTPTITGHRTMSETSCPGDNFNPYVAGQLTADVEVHRDGAPSPASSTTLTTTAPSTTRATTPPTTTMTTETTSTIRDPTMSEAAPVSSATTPIPTTTTPVAAAPPAGSRAPVGVLATAGALVVTGGGLLVWRYRRMGS